MGEPKQANQPWATGPAWGYPHGLCTLQTSIGVLFRHVKKFIASLEICDVLDKPAINLAVKDDTPRASWLTQDNAKSGVPPAQRARGTPLLAKHLSRLAQQRFGQAAGDADERAAG